MIKRSLSAISVASIVVFLNASSALAEAADPTKVGDNVKGIVMPNAKAFWIVLLIGGLLFMAATRKAGRAAATGVFLIISGVAIWNPAGVGSMMQGLAEKIV